MTFTVERPFDADQLRGNGRAPRSVSLSMSGSDARGVADEVEARLESVDRLLTCLRLKQPMATAPMTTHCANSARSDRIRGTRLEYGRPQRARDEVVAAEQHVTFHAPGRRR